MTKKEERELKGLIDEQKREMDRESNPTYYRSGKKHYNKGKWGIQIK